MTRQLSTEPNAMPTLAMWLNYLEKLHYQSMELGLDRIRCVADRLNVTALQPYVITVAGTNGKGTTCRMLEAILMKSGYRVGVYSSPHLLHFNERVRIQNRLPDDTEYITAFEQIERSRGEVSLTFFEFTTLAALLLFKQANLDVVILEVGLGGRLDATNVVAPDLAVITSIDLDHTEILGKTRDAIGYEKAGIFRSGRLAVVGEPDLPGSVIAYAETLGAPLKSYAQGDWQYTVQKDGTWQWTAGLQAYTQLPMPRIPLANAATALATLHYSPFAPVFAAVKDALSFATLPGRLQHIQTSPTVILDVAHNPHAATYLNDQINHVADTLPAGGKRRIVVGMLKDKDIPSTLRALCADVWYCGSLNHFRGADAHELAQYLPDNRTKTFTSIQEAWQSALTDAAKDDIIVVCGSFHTVADVMGTLIYE